MTASAVVLGAVLVSEQAVNATIASMTVYFLTTPDSPWVKEAKYSNFSRAFNTCN